MKWFWKSLVFKIEAVVLDGKQTKNPIQIVANSPIEKPILQFSSSNSNHPEISLRLQQRNNMHSNTLVFQTFTLFSKFEKILFKW